jgi:hypothetical protein
MRTGSRHPSLLTPPALIGACAVLLSAAAAVWPQGAGAEVAPLPASNYSVRSVCQAPESGDAGCLALELVPETSAARAHSHPLGVTADAALAPHASPTSGAYGLSPSDLHHAYKLPSEAGTSQTIALVDAYDDPHAEADLRVYSEAFGLPACTSANGCFRKVNQRGEANHLPEANEGWAVEISLDIETAHAICQNCHILLVEAANASYEDLATAELTAGRLGANEISNSWGGPEAGEPAAQENATAFNQPGVVITASAGDAGYLNWDGGGEGSYANFPASSPHVVAVGGTRLELTAGGAWSSESVWNGLGAGGGGCSAVFTAPAWQQAVSDWSSVGCAGHRSVADVAADADPYTGVAVYDSSSECESERSVHWCPIGGTSLSSPLIAAVYALAGGSHGVAYPAKTLYEAEVNAPGALHDISNGSNGACSAYFTSEGLSGCSAAQEAATSCNSELRCAAGTGYDGPSGVGTPRGIAAFEPGTSVPAVSEEPEEAPAAPTANTPAAPAAPAPQTPAPPSKPAVPVVSGLTLSHGAQAAAVRALARVSTVAFSFTLNIATRVRASLAVRATVHGRTTWATLPKALEIAARAGLDHGRIPARDKLIPGLYRLTLTPSGGDASSIIFRVI